MENENEPKTTIIAETANFIAWQSEEPDSEILFHIEINNVTLHFFLEEWQEFIDLIKILNKKFIN